MVKDVPADENHSVSYLPSIDGGLPRSIICGRPIIDDSHVCVQGDGDLEVVGRLEYLNGVNVYGVNPNLSLGQDVMRGYMHRCRMLGQTPNPKVIRELERLG